MAKFYGQIGFGITLETIPGVWTEEIKEVNAYGDILKNYRQLNNPGQVNDNITVSNQISIMMDPFLSENFHHIKYVKFMGIRWAVNSVSVEYPRLILTLGGEYNVPQT